MEFWGVEVKSGESLKVNPGDGMVLHLSQASLGELKKEKGTDSVCLFVNVEGKKLVLGTLFTDKLHQQQFDLVFDKEFELSHNWKNGGVYFYGYKARNPLDDHEFPEGDSDESESEEDIPTITAANGKSEPVAKQNKSAAAAKSVAAKDKDSKPDKQVTIVEPSKVSKPQHDDKSSDDDLMSEDDNDDSEDENDSDDESNEDTPKKVESSKKRASESASKTPLPDKKAKVTPQKTDGKKGGGHVSTPYPAKQAGKAQQTPKSGGSHSCTSCNRSFGSDNALESHNKAKHGDGK